MIRRAASTLVVAASVLLGAGIAAQTVAHGKKLPAAKVSSAAKRKTAAGKKAPGKALGAHPVGAHAVVHKASSARAGATPVYRQVAADLPRTIHSREATIEAIGARLANPTRKIENAQVLRPFFDRLHELEVNPGGPVVRILQFGDSHTAADMFTGALRSLFQGRWGDGGAGFSYAGYPFAGYRIHGTRRQQSVDWLVEGTHFHDLGDDALVGMGGVSLTTDQAGSWVSLDADASSVEVDYLTQPDGGPIAIYDSDALVATVPTAGPVAAGRFVAPVAAGSHHFEVRTTESARVALLGLTTQNASGVTYEAIGLNGAEASLLLRWDEALATPYMAAASPALIVLSYGTNEAGDHNWSEAGYATMFRSLIERCRRMAANAPILVIGPPDRELRAGRRGWAPFVGVDRIVEAQREVCRQMGCAYWDTRRRMGGFGSIGEWVSVGWAQGDHTHFTGDGYTQLASALFTDLAEQYKLQEESATVATGGER